MPMFVLQNFVFPTAEEQECKELFVRKSEMVLDAFGKNICKLEELSFDTWMNIFAASKWYHYCEIGKLYLGINIEGDFILEVVGTKLNAAFCMINEVLFQKEYKNHKNENSTYIELPSVKEYDAVFLNLKYLKENPCTVYSIDWFTDVAPKYDNDMAIVTCTYKREQYINKTISIFRKYIKDNHNLASKMHLFVIDNGKTIPLDKGDENIEIVPNINAGGAGGFGRGMIEVCKAKRNYTRCLLMDDDVKILPESFGRTLQFSNYLKEEYQNATINGAMLDFYAPNMFFENVVVQEGLWVRPVHDECNLIDYINVLKVNIYNDVIWKNSYPKQDAAWFYSCIPINKESINNLPMPIFIRGDDVEYGWRSNGKAFIQLNGICIWHANFYYRVNKLTDVYYLVRNMMINNMIYTNGFETQYKRLLKDNYKYLNATYDYKSVELLNIALKDVLGKGKFFEKNPEELHKKLSAIATEDFIAEDNWYTLESVRNKVYHYGKLEKSVNYAAKAVFKLIPATKIIAKKNSEKAVGEWYPPTDAFLFRKHIRVYNLLKHSYYYRHYDYSKEKALKKDFNHIMRVLDKKYYELKEFYKQEHKVLISYDFWKKYLELE